MLKLFVKEDMKNHLYQKLNDSEGEAAETQTWLEFSLECNYINRNDYDLLINEGDYILDIPKLFAYIYSR